MNGRNQRIGRWSLLIVPVILTGFIAGLTTGPSEAQPPDIQQVNDHWSAWQPPASIPEGAEAYTVQDGDTLWALAQRHFGDPYLWPQLWEANPQILDAQWIYPGDTVIIPGSRVASAAGVAGPPLSEPPVTGAPSADDPYQAVISGDGSIDPATGEPAPAAPDFSSTTRQAASAAPIPLGYESDIYCSGFVGGEDESFPYEIAGSEYEFLHPTLDPASKSEVKGLWGKSDTVKFLLGLGDIIYLDSGRADGLSAGMTLVVVRPEERLVHPLTKKGVGRLYTYQSRVRVLSVQEETSIAEIIGVCNPPTVGDRLRLFTAEPVPLRRLTPMRPVNFPDSSEAIADGATIVAARDEIVALGTGHLFYLDWGKVEDVAPGDIFTIYRQGRRGFPPVVLGEAAILSVSDRGSLARILRSRYAIFVGDALVAK